MKKSIFAILLFFINFAVCFAENITVEYQISGQSYVLEVTCDDQNIDYNMAVEKYNLEKYMQIYIDGKYHYFYLGNEIDRKSYEKGLDEEKIDKYCSLSNNICVKVSTTDDIINQIDEIYSSKKAAIYYLTYTSLDYANIDFEYIDQYYSQKYLSDTQKNIYKYDEYAYRKPEKFLPNRDESGIIIDTMTILTDDEEILKVDKFLDDFLKLFEGKSDYEKVLGAYTYINNVTSYVEDAGYTVFKDALLSSYDVLFKHKSACIGVATTFQLLMERLGIESYIVDHVSANDADKYVITHTYNVVKLDGRWYIVDIAFDENLSGLLKGMSNYYSAEDFQYYDIKISDSSYFDIHPNMSKSFEFDYASLLALIQKIDKFDNKNEMNEILEKKKSYVVEYILIAIILLVIWTIIWYFTRKK